MENSGSCLSTRCTALDWHEYCFEYCFLGTSGSVKSETISDQMILDEEGVHPYHRVVIDFPSGQEAVMKMILVIYRRSLDHDLRQLLKGLDIKAFTEAPKILGVGEARQAFEAMTWPGHNSIILSAMNDDQVDKVIEELKAFCDHLSSLQGGTKIPIRVFTSPCEQVI